MLIVPVLDLKGGLVVRGVAGRRDTYQPVSSLLCPTAQPADVGRAFVRELGLSVIYIADLDAIGGLPPAWSTYRSLYRAGIDLWVDAGLRDVGQAQPFCGPENRMGTVIVGLETVAGIRALERILGAVGPDRLQFSVDLKQGKPLTQDPEWQGSTPREIAHAAWTVGVRRFIVLDLSRVGVGQGVGTESVCRELRHLAPTAQIIAGGGVRGRDDLESLSRAGCDGALVASALHDGRITRADVEAIGGR